MRSHYDNLYNNLAEIFRLRDVVGALDPQGAPRAVVVDRRHAMRHTSIAVVPGSFNPLTVAHTALADATKRSFVYFLVSKVTIDKERIDSARVEDRLLALEAFAQARGAAGVLATNRGLYVEEAIAVREALPDLDDLHFAIGLDKLIQIFDRRYYADRDAALRELFSLTRLVVAARALTGQPARQPVDFGRLLDRPENSPFGTNVARADLPSRLFGLSSSAVRERCAKGLSIKRFVPNEVVALIIATGAYLSPSRLPSGESVDRYEVRNALIDALDVERQWALEQVDFPKLLAQAWSDSPDGRKLRDALTRPADRARVLALLHSLS